MSSGPKQFTGHAQDPGYDEREEDRPAHRPTHHARTPPGKVSGLPPNPAKPIVHIALCCPHFLHFAHTVGASGDLTGKNEGAEATAGPGPIKVTTPEAKASARSVGQQREHSWARHLSPAVTSGTNACGLVAKDQPQAAALETPEPTRL